ncbi:MAG: hypothetical protein HKN24_15105 [Acidimicrobiales bacterium]|nr:hypothetical protein [Acidimicrobiales bacterium]
MTDTEHDPGSYDIEFFWDPVCPFAWVTSRWIRKVQDQRHYSVNWRFISLRLLNSHIDYDAHFPPEYEQGHTAGLRMLRVAAAIRRDRGVDAMGPLYDAFGSSVFDVDRRPDGDPGAQPRSWLGTMEHLQSVLAPLGHDLGYAAAADDDSLTSMVQTDTDDALERTGRDVGTPIIAFHPPDGPAFFGPVISRVPNDEDSLMLWDSVITLASFPGFAEMKRSLREQPQLRAFGLEPGDAGIQEDWKAGSRRWD